MKKNENSIELFSTVSPENLTQRLQEIGVELKFIKNHYVKYFYLIHRIYSHDVINKNEEECRLHSDVLRNLFGSYYPTIIDQLIKIGVIQQTSNYWAGERSNGYILIEDRGARLYEFGDEHRFVKKMLTQDKPRVQKHTETLSRLFQALSNLQYAHIERDSLSESEQKFLFFLENNLFQTVGELGKRVYNNFCNLPKSLRSKLKLNGEELVFVDIVNSQMVFLAAVVKKTLLNQNKILDSSTQKFLNLTGTGKLYEFLMSESSITDRAELKNQVFQMIFGQKSYSKILSKKFNQLFPQVIEVIKYLKKDDHKVLAHQMQQMEAKVVFRALNSIDYQKDVLTVHDSLYAAKSEKNTILEALVESFKKEGLDAVININDESRVQVAEHDSYLNQIEAIMQDLPKSKNETENGIIVEDFESVDLSAVEEHMKFLNHISLIDLNKYCEMYKLSQRINSRDEIEKIRMVAKKMAITEALHEASYSGDEFDDLPF
jgi:hypothetical protein